LPRDTPILNPKSDLLYCDTTASLRVLDTLTDVSLSVCVRARACVCVSVSEASSLTLLQSKPSFYMTNSVKMLALRTSEVYRYHHLQHNQHNIP